MIRFAEEFTGVSWQPSDPEPAARASILAWSAEATAAEVAPPLDLDVVRDGWWSPIGPGLAAIVAINLLHIAPWAATTGLMAGSARLLAPRGLLYIYGCFMRDGVHTAPSNAAFDQWLRDHDPAWGVRDLADVDAAAAARGLRLSEIIAMPANNFSLIVRRG